MKIITGRFYYGMILLFLWVTTLVRSEALPEAGSERGEFIKAVHELFWEEDFARLDKMQEKFWRERARFDDGCCKLSFLYIGLAVDGGSKESFDWSVYWGKFDRWDKAFPESTLAKIMRARALCTYAWDARGGGWASTVTGEGWALMEDRLKQAMAVLESDPRLKQYPGYYSVMQTIALGQGWDKKRYGKMWGEAMALAPEYETFYFYRSNFLQPKWHGEPGEWLRFAEQSAAANKNVSGDMMYARIIWAQLGVGNLKGFLEAGIDWPRMRQGFEDMMRLYPLSLWNKHAYCRFAIHARDRTTARRLFEELGDRYVVGIWGSEKAYTSAKRWAMAGGIVTPPSPQSGPIKLESF